MEGLFEGAADGHGFADGFHGGGEGALGAFEFFEGKARDFCDDVIDCWLEGGRDLSACDVVVEFIERVADGEFGGNFGDGEASGFGCERG